MADEVNWPNPHDGGRCDASPDGSVGFYAAEPLGNGVMIVECPNVCGWWREFDAATGRVIDGDRRDALTATSPNEGNDR